MDSIAITLTDKKAIDGWISAYNERPEGSVEEMILHAMTQQGKSYASIYAVDIIPTAEFVLRFTPDEFRAAQEAGKTDDIIGKFLSETMAAPYVSMETLDKSPGIARMGILGILSSARKAELLTVPRPTPVDPPAPEPELVNA